MIKVYQSYHMHKFINLYYLLCLRVFAILWQIFNRYEYILKAGHDSMLSMSCFITGEWIPWAVYMLLLAPSWAILIFGQACPYSDIAKDHSLSRFHHQLVHYKWYRYMQIYYWQCLWKNMPQLHQIYLLTIDIFP